MSRIVEFLLRCIEEDEARVATFPLVTRHADGTVSTDNVVTCRPVEAS